MRILVVEDDPLILNGLTMGLSLHGMVVDGVSNCEDAHAALATTQFNAVVLDWMLPDGSGIDILRLMRNRKDTTPVLLLTARDAVEDRIRGLDEGADDYLGKPFDLDEVAARLRALDRRAAGRSMPNLVWQDLTLNPATMEVSLETKPLILSRREFAVLSALMERPGIVVQELRRMSYRDLQEHQLRRNPSWILDEQGVVRHDERRGKFVGDGVMGSASLIE